MTSTLKVLLYGLDKCSSLYGIFTSKSVYTVLSYPGFIRKHPKKADFSAQFKLSTFASKNYVQFK